MNTLVYDRLIEVARQKRLTTYSEIGAVADLDVSNLPELDSLARILEELAELDRQHGRPLLIVLVIREDLGMPAKGFFKYTRARGIQPRDMDDLSFFAKEINRVYEAWT